MKNNNTQAYQESEYCFPYHYVSNMPSIGFTQHFVDSWGINYISTIDFLLQHIEKCQPKSLIDIGCGDGRLTREIHIRFPSIKVIGIDYSLRAIALAKAMNQDYPDIQYEKIDISKNDFSEKYDVAILMEVFEHIPLDEAEVFLCGIHRALKSGGILFLTVPHINKPVEYKHFQHFSVETISDYLSPHFHVAETIPFEKKGFSRRMLEKLLCNNLFVLNNKKLLKYLYSVNQKYLFNCIDENECQRIFIKAVAK